MGPESAPRATSYSTLPHPLPPWPPAGPQEPRKAVLWAQHRAVKPFQRGPRAPGAGEHCPGWWVVTRRVLQSTWPTRPFVPAWPAGWLGRGRPGCSRCDGQLPPPSPQGRPGLLLAFGEPQPGGRARPGTRATSWGWAASWRARAGVGARHAPSRASLPADPGVQDRQTEAAAPVPVGTLTSGPSNCSPGLGCQPPRPLCPGSRAFTARACLWWLPSGPRAHLVTLSPGN